MSAKPQRKYLCLTFYSISSKASKTHSNYFEFNIRDIHLNLQMCKRINLYYELIERTLNSICINTL